MKKLKLVIGLILTAGLLFSTGCKHSSNDTSSDTSNGTNTEQTSGTQKETTENDEEENQNEEENNDTNVPKAQVGDFEIGSTSVEMAKNMAIGWNLGNTLDATTDYTDSNGTYHFTQNSGLNTETNWGMPETTKAMITAIKNAGFKTIRIPVSWHNHITDTNNYTIDSSWMARVKEVVDYAYSQNMCVIINIHHDNMAISKMTDYYGFALTDDETINTKSKTYIEKIWTQIATTFASYDNKLVFEVLNEPRDINGEFATEKSYTNNSEWWSNQQTTMDIITAYEQVAVDAIRAVSGNENRYLMVPGYAASGSDSSMLALYTMPTDTATDKLILSGHAYSPYAFAMSDTTDTTFDASDKSSLDSIFSYLKTNYTDKGIGVVMGEASASDKNNLSDRVAWSTYYFTKALESKIPVVLWDNMVTVANGGNISSGECHGYYNRKENTWYFPTMIEAMMSAVYGENYTTN
ncbi:MAG: glycoside hydrolase family 5 protein [Treponema sp.]|nr:glycoside hydrolase family 5 protein [Treponema sp.]